MNEMLASLGQVRDTVGALDSTSLSDPEVVDGLAEVFALEQQLAAVRLSMINDLVARKVPKRRSATSAAAWLGATLRISHYAAGKMIRLARALPLSTPGIRDALAAGEINVDQAAVVVQAVSRLPEACRPRGETHMLGLVSELNSAQLRKVGIHLHDEVDAEGARLRRREVLAARTRRDKARRGIHLSQVDGDTMVVVRGRMERATADIVRAALDPFRAPHDSPDAADPPAAARLAAADRRTPAARRLDALKEMCLFVLAEKPTRGEGLRAVRDSDRHAVAAAGKSERRRSRRQQRHQSKKRPPASVRRSSGVRRRQG